MKMRCIAIQYNIIWCVRFVQQGRLLYAALGWLRKQLVGCSRWTACSRMAVQVVRGVARSRSDGGHIAWAAGAAHRACGCCMLCNTICTLRHALRRIRVAQKGRGRTGCTLLLCATGSTGCTHGCTTQSVQKVCSCLSSNKHHCFCTPLLLLMNVHPSVKAAILQTTMSRLRERCMCRVFPYSEVKA